MKKINASQITELVEKLCIEANTVLTKDIRDSFALNIKRESSALGREILATLTENATIAREERSPICQDTGMAVVFVTMGQEVHIEGGYIEDAINQGVRQGYEKGFL